MKFKSIYTSKTVWFNVVIFLIAIIPATAALVKALEPEQAIAIDAVASFVGVVGNTVLRVFFTDSGIASKATVEYKNTLES